MSIIIKQMSNQHFMACSDSQGNQSLHGTHNAARKVIESVSYVAGTISSVSAKPAKLLSEWTADQIAPAYWVPNSQITVGLTRAYGGGGGGQDIRLAQVGLVIVRQVSK